MCSTKVQVLILVYVLRRSIFDNKRVTISRGKSKRIVPLLSSVLVKMLHSTRVAHSACVCDSPACDTEVETCWGCSEDTLAEGN